MKALSMNRPALAVVKTVSLSKIIKEVIATLGTWKTRMEQRRQLLTLDDRMLQDIGITRSDAVNEFQKKVWEA